MTTFTPERIGIGIWTAIDTDYGSKAEALAAIERFKSERLPTTYWNYRIVKKSGDKTSIIHSEYFNNTKSTQP